MMRSPVAIAPIAAPIMIARRPALFGMSSIQSASSGSHGWIARPIGARPIRMMIAETSSSAASALRARKARNAAEAMKNASSANMVALHGAKM